ncbi:MAG: CDP-diacylglycerol--serine O-phosphatidyltransferase [Desulfatibacillaceae bacterium]
MSRRKKRRLKKPDLHKGVYILPNLFTTLNMFSGFYAIISAINGLFVHAALAIFAATFFDAADGRVARATKSTSRFGIEYDSLADLVSFGMAPGIMMYLWALEPWGRLGWLAGFLFMACGALRLARFNTQVGQVSSEYFIGLPIPAAAAMCAATMLFFHRLGMATPNYPLLILVLVYILSFLMVSTIKYFSFKKPELFREKSFNVLVAVLLVLVLIAAEAAVSLFILGLGYIASGPVNSLRLMRKAQLEEEAEQADNSPSENAV